MSYTHLLVGANRGIGLALAIEILEKYPKDIVYATTRNVHDSKDLDELSAANKGRVVIVQLDMLDEQSVKSAVAKVSETTKSLDNILINAGISIGYGPIADLAAADLLKNLEGNIVGPHNVIRFFLPLLQASTAPKRVLTLMSSIVSSVNQANEVAAFLANAASLPYNPISGYTVTKSGASMLARQWALVLEPKGIIVVAVHPGLVETRMTHGLSGAITPTESAKGLVKVIEGLDPKTAPEVTKKGILSYDGTTIPW